MRSSKTLLRAWRLTLISTMSATLIGCGADAKRPVFAPVRGIVTYRGKPVPGAVVSFLGHGSPRPASGITDANGRYELSTFDPGDGAVVGTHVVTVYKAAIAIKPTGIDPNLDPRAYAAAMEEAAARAIKAQSAGTLLPTKYANVSTSDLRQEVAAGENEINLELSD